MPIVKETSARLVKRNITHDAISREVVQAITNPVALAIYTYLLTKPADWTVRRQDILDHFEGLGRDRYDGAMRQLKSLGLLWVAKIQGENGRFIGNEIILEQTLEPNCMKTDHRENPTLGKSDHLKKKRVIKEEEKGLKGGEIPPPEGVDPQAWALWVQHRREIRKKLTPTSVKSQAKLLCSYPDQQMEIIEQSIRNGWTGLFELKESRNGKAGKPNGQGGKLSGAEKTRRARELARASYPS